MTTSTEERTGTAAGSNGATEVAVVGKEISNGRFALTNGALRHVPGAPAAKLEQPVSERRALALICYEPPDSPIGQYAAKLAVAAAARQMVVHLFCRHDYVLPAAGVILHEVGDTLDGALLDQVNVFTSRVCNAFHQAFPAGSGPVRVVGLEWSSVPALTLLQGTRPCETILSLHSLERQRSDMRSELSQQIEQIELTGLRQAHTILVQEPAVGEIAKYWVPECAARLVMARQSFPIDSFQTGVDAGSIKARYQIGPIDPTILYVGDLDDRHGPDLLMKALPTVLRNHKQTRVIYVGDGELLWPLRVYARYLFLEYAVRLPGHVSGQELHELFQAADIVMVPSRVQTEWWPLLAGWAASKPVITTHQMAKPLSLTHEQNAILIYPAESSCVWGIERVLNNWELARTVGTSGHQFLQERFGWNSVAQQLEELCGASPSN